MNYSPPLTVLAKFQKMVEEPAARFASIANLELYLAGGQAEPAAMAEPVWYPGMKLQPGSAAGESDCRSLLLPGVRVPKDSDDGKARKLMTAVAWHSIHVGFPESTVCVWDGGIIDSACEGAESMYGEVFDQSLFPLPRCAFMFLPDPDGRRSEVWSRWEEEFRSTYRKRGMAGADRYSLRAVYCAGVGADTYLERMEESEYVNTRSVSQAAGWAFDEEEERHAAQTIRAARILVAYLLEHPRDGLRIAMVNYYLRDEVLSGGACEVYALAAYMALPFVRRERAERSRAMGVWAPRAKEPVLNRVVLYRRAAPAEGRGGDGRSYSCQFAVSGHWRRLHQPRKADGKRVIRIEPYLKGPSGAPLKPVGKVMRSVKR